MLKIFQSALFCGTILVATHLQAADGDPVAVIGSADGSVSIETMWNLSVTVFDTANNSPKSGLATTPLRGRAGVYLTRVEKADVALHTEKRAKLFRVNFSAESNIDHVLDRQPNHANATWLPSPTSKTPSADSPATEPSPNAVHVQNVDGALIVKVDGLKIAQVNSGELSDAAIQAMANCDALVYTGDATQNQKILDSARGAKASVLILRSPGDVESVDQLSANTLALSAQKRPAGDSMRIVSFAQSVPKASGDLTKLIEAKEAACRDSQKVFAALTTAQMNFKPSNGSHTPRWNTEHMMGRELLFFSQIFHAVDDTIPVIDLNPKQMPPDYKAKHADWTGNEEARQMERVTAFTRRFAHLLNELPLDKKAPGSFWTPRKLLLQMDRHYSEHTANVQKKFKLPDWPSK